MKYEVTLPDKWSEEGELAIIKENANGSNTILRVVESLGDASSSLSSQFYIVKEPPVTGHEILADADSKEEAKMELIDAARDMP